MTANNSFDDEVVCSRGGSNPDTKIDLPLRRNMQVRHREDLLLLIVERVETSQPAVVCVVFDTAADLPGEVVTHLYGERESDA